jgi:hypothetical protein
VPETKTQTKNWREWLKTTDPRDVQRRFEFYFKRANAKIGQEFVRAAKNSIRARDYAANAPLTVALKGSGLPLADNGDLLASLTYKVESHARVWIGIGPSPKAGASGRQIYEVLHNGARIKVTGEMLQAMRIRLAEMESAGKFKGREKQAKQQHASAIAGARRALGSHDKARPKVRGGGYWIIPPRPYIMQTLGAPIFQAAVEFHHGEALELTLHEPLSAFKAKAARARAERSFLAEVGKATRKMKKRERAKAARGRKRAKAKRLKAKAKKIRTRGRK